MQKLFYYWKTLRYILCSIVILWAFILIFKDGNYNGARILFLIAGIGISSTLFFDWYRRKRIVPK